MQTIIAAYDDRQSAQSAVDRLVQNGFSRDAVHLEPGYGAEPAASASGSSATTGNFFGDLFDNDSNAADAGKYAEAVRRGTTVVVVDARDDTEVSKAERVLDELDAIDVDQRAAYWQSQGWNGFDPDAKPLSSEELTAERDNIIPVIREELEVGKRTVRTGQVRVVQRVTETPVTQLVQLVRERAVVERRPVNRVATEADFAGFKDGTIDIVETAEEVVVSKSARVVEEVHVGKTMTESEQTVSDTVRHTEVEVERIGSGATTTQVGSGTATTQVGNVALGSSGSSGSSVLGSDANRDPITGEPGAHPVGTGVGAALGGAAAGAVTGTVAGPVGTVVGAAVGAIAGGLAGKGVAEKVDPTRKDI